MRPHKFDLQERVVMISFLWTYMCVSDYLCGSFNSGTIAAQSIHHFRKALWTFKGGKKNFVHLSRLAGNVDRSNGKWLFYRGLTPAVARTRVWRNQLVFIIFWQLTKMIAEMEGARMCMLCQLLRHTSLFVNNFESLRSLVMFYNWEYCFNVFDFTTRWFWINTNSENMHSKAIMANRIMRKTNVEIQCWWKMQKRIKISKIFRWE